MAFDARNQLYARAIRNSVDPGSVVLDLGAGIGVHGLIAAAAGAKRVFLVEPQPVVQAARDIARANGLADRVVIYQDHIEDVVLPEKVDLIVSVFTGNLLFTEDLLPSLFHARDRYLKPGGRLLPDRAELWLAPICAPQLHAKHVSCWSDSRLHGLDYSLARAFAANEMLFLERDALHGSTRLAPGAVLSEVDLAAATSADCKGEARSRVEVSGLCHGLLGWIRIKLEDEWMSTAPDSPPVHWSPVMLPIDPPLALAEGEDLAMTLLRPAHGDWTWSVTSGGESRRHSTFLAGFEGLERLGRRAPSYRAGLSEEGARVAHILALFADGLSNQQIADRLANDECVELGQMLVRVQALAMRYGKRS